MLKYLMSKNDFYQYTGVIYKMAKVDDCITSEN